MSISVGGNDAGFSGVLTECAQPGWLSNCNAAIDKAQAFITNTLPGRLSTLYASIRSKAPSAKVVVVGYPRIFNGEDCNAGTWFSPAEETRLNATADLLNSKTSAQASAKGFAFANPTSRFVGSRGVRQHRVAERPVEPDLGELPPQQGRPRQRLHAGRQPAADRRPLAGVPVPAGPR